MIRFTARNRCCFIPALPETSLLLRSFIARVGRRIIQRAFPALVLSLVAACSALANEPTIVPTPIEIRVVQFSNPHAFDLKYPSNWRGVLVTQGVMVFGPPNVVGIREPGPSVTVYRISEHTASGTDEELFDKFIGRGPLRGSFEITGPVEVAQVGQYQGLGVDMQREAEEELIAMRGKVWMARTGSGAVYFLSATSPTDSWDDVWPNMQAVLDSVHFNE